jgi:hypothetical protein
MTSAASDPDLYSTFAPALRALREIATKSTLLLAAQAQAIGMVPAVIIMTAIDLITRQVLFSRQISFRSSFGDRRHCNSFHAKVPSHFAKTMGIKVLWVIVNEKSLRI